MAIPNGRRNIAHEIHRWRSNAASTGSVTLKAVSA